MDFLGTWILRWDSLPHLWARARAPLPVGLQCVRVRAWPGSVGIGWGWNGSTHRTTRWHKLVHNHLADGGSKASLGYIASSKKQPGPRGFVSKITYKSPQITSTTTKEASSSWPRAVVPDEDWRIRAAYLIINDRPIQPSFRSSSSLVE